MIQTHQENEKGKGRGRGRRNQAKNHAKRSPAMKTDLQENFQETKISKLPKQELSQQNHQQFSGNYGIVDQQMQPRIMCQGNNVYTIQFPHQNFPNPPQTQNPSVQTYKQNMPPTPTYPQRHQPNTGAGVVHAWVGQILLNCDVFKRLFVRPTDTRVGRHDDA